MVGCLFGHKWVLQTDSSLQRDGFNVRYAIPYRRCERCGKLERGVRDAFWRDIVWEPLRQGTDILSERPRFFRQPTGLLDQLAHSWGMRRSRASDRQG